MARLSHEKNELVNAIIDGIRVYLQSTRGASVLGTQTAVSRVDGSTVQVEAKLKGEQVFFEIKVKAPWS